MSKTVIEEFDLCHKLSEEIKHFLPIEKRKYLEISHVVSCSDFVIFISYDKKNFGAEIKNFVSDIIEEAKKSELSRYGWKVHRPLVEEKKMSTILCLVTKSILSLQCSKKKKCLLFTH